MATPHTHQVVFGRRVTGCPRCTELAVGMPPVRWSNHRAAADAQRRADIRNHDCKTARCGPVCTFGDP